MTNILCVPASIECKKNFCEHSCSQASIQTQIYIITFISSNIELGGKESLHTLTQPGKHVDQPILVFKQCTMKKKKLHAQKTKKPNPRENNNDTRNLTRSCHKGTRNLTCLIFPAKCVCCNYSAVQKHV
jgi:hypothetical protein